MVSDQKYVLLFKAKFVFANQQELKHIARKGGKKRVKMYPISHCAKMYSAAVG